MTLSLERIRGSRECRVRAAPAVSCARLCEETHTSIQVQRRQSGIPCAMVLRLMPCSPRRRIRFVTVASGLRLDPSPVGPTHLRRLDISNGCQDHTVLPYATSAVRPARREPLTSSISPCDHLARRRCRVHRIPSRVRDDRDTPLCRERTGRAGRTDLPDGESGIFFAGGLDRANQPEIIAENRAMAHRPRGRPIPVHSFGEPCWIFGRSIHQFWRGTA